MAGCRRRYEDEIANSTFQIPIVVPMNVRFPRQLLALCAALPLASCTLFEPGAPAAATTVRARSAFQVADVVERVFVDEGYQTTQRTQEGMTFERPGSKTDRVLYGNWIEGDIAQRITVNITQRSDDSYRVRCLPSVVRDPHDISFEDPHRRLQLYSFHCAHLLREVRRQCASLWASRASDESG
ncbi:MAG TPA: hypothetical protein VEO95_11140 [Chthoniobacteraceae bacterium]|nr:hypothetical protein [Chthoniobacteraceae bacterium]